ncbi:MAG: AsmA family protein [Lautropia sp.]|nr:AsmA family protein [Lautropia sp.]
MIKRLSIAIGVLLGLLVIAAVAVSFVDVNYFKPQIARFVETRYHRTLSFDGNLKLSIFPSVGVTLPVVRLSEPGHADREAASLKGARVSVALLPLLKGQVQADSVTLDGLKAKVVRLPDGHLSIDDLLGGQPEAGAQPAPEEGKSAATPVFHVNGVTLTNAQIVFDDRQAAQTYTLERVNLETGPLANVIETPLTMSLGFAATTPEARGDFTLKGQLSIDLEHNRFGVSDMTAGMKGAIDTLQLQQFAFKLKGFSLDPAGPVIQVSDMALDAQGRMGADSFRSTLAVPKLAITQDKASGDAVQAHWSMGDKEWLTAALTMTGVGGTADNLQIGRLGLDATLKQDGRKVLAKLVSPVQASLAGGRYQLSALDGQVDIEDPALPKAASSLKLSGKVAADLKKEKASADLSALLDQAKMVLKAAVNGFKTPRIALALDADALNVDRLFPPAKASSATAPAATPTAAPGNAAETPVDLSALKNLALDARVSIDHLIARGLEARQLRASAKIANGQLVLSPVTAALYQGHLNAAAQVATGSSPAANKVALKADLSGIEIEPLLKGLLKQDMLEGSGNVTLDVNTGGGTVEALKRSLGGSAALSLKNGALKGINLGEKLREARNMFRASAGTQRQVADSRQKTDFTELGVSFQLQNGVARSNDLSLKSPLLRVGGDGSIDIGRSVLDYTVRASVVGTSSGQGGRDLADLHGVTIPVRLTGPFDAPAWQIDWAAAGKEALKSKVGNEVKEKAESALKKTLEKNGLSDKLKDKVDTKKAKDLLKGFLSH